ncbi:nitroreductase family deazaflavin-dependent oxidoreductase [Actinomadura viridis]|uniref:Deazaflavin-dependent oxidoreductase (Nitroreductase family) n=1 Tax=Actinomadura viridis TaxID=58110 RepID=A0A931DN71_9ACTN|nr:nitroreductase family deazaflavin-dependent oxidoreductase [Actinomadura viridis]MBG6090671.1 deazaflavin-dependent oxidoreductase (nitroreductase family) [Actinomadura viridis]
MTITSDRYVRPAGLEAHFNRVAAFLTRHGISLLGTRILAVRGHKSGEWRTNPVNLLTHEGERYLLAPRGHTHWVRNIRAAGGGELRLGRSTEPFTAVELPDEEKVPLLRAYFERWGWEVARFFEDLPKKPTDEQLAGVAPGVPVFRVLPAEGDGRRG